MDKKNVIEQYISELQQNNQVHIGELFDYCKEYLMKMVHAKNFTFSAYWDVDDYIMEVIDKVVFECERYDANRGSFNTWMSMMANSVYCAYYKKAHEECIISFWGRNEDGEEYNIVDNYLVSDSCEDEVISQSNYDEIIKSIEALPENYRKVIRLCCVEEYEVFEAAKIVGCKGEDISRWRNRGKGVLAKKLEYIYKQKCDDRDRE